MEIKFFRCNNCGNVIVKVVDSGVVPVCCGEEMEELKPQTTEKGQEKHIPVATMDEKKNLNVKIGSVPHPMTLEHHIEFVAVETNNGCHISFLDGPAETKMNLGLEKPQAVYEFCNLHGLWKTTEILKEKKKCCDFFSYF